MPCLRPFFNSNCQSWDKICKKYKIKLEIKNNQKVEFIYHINKICYNKNKKGSKYENSNHRR